MKNVIYRILAAGLFSLAAANVQAVVVLESGDAGETLGGEQVLGAGTTSVTGSLSGDADLFRFAWSGGAISIDTSGSGFDTQLSLFDAAGFGLIHDDDGGAGLLSMINTVLAAGEYLIGISGFNYDPVSAGGNIFPTGFPGPYGPSGPGGGQVLTGWSGTSFSSGSYAINFSGPTSAVPEPTTLALLGLGLAGFGVSRRRRKI